MIFESVKLFFIICLAGEKVIALKNIKYTITDLRCPGYNEIYTDCLNDCELTCDDLLNNGGQSSSSNCKSLPTLSSEEYSNESSEEDFDSEEENSDESNGVCEQGCICKPGTVRNSNHICVEEDVCDSDFYGVLVGEWGLHPHKMRTAVKETRMFLDCDIEPPGICKSNQDQEEHQFGMSEIDNKKLRVTVCDINNPDECREITLEGGLPSERMNCPEEFCPIKSNQENVQKQLRVKVCDINNPDKCTEIEIPKASTQDKVVPRKQHSEGREVVVTVCNINNQGDCKDINLLDRTESEDSFESDEDYSDEDEVPRQNTPKLLFLIRG